MRDKDTLSKRQQQILDFIKFHIKEHGYPPSVREIGQATGLKSTSTVHTHLANLEAKGCLRRDPAKPRAIEILSYDDEPESPETIALPIVGRIAAGEPITAFENLEGYFSVSADFLGRGQHFILRVKGDSMIDAGILDGDMVIVRSQEVANNGDIVVALLDDEATVKRYFRKTDHIELRPENQSMKSILCRDVSITGVVSGLIRKLEYHGNDQ